MTFDEYFTSIYQQRWPTLKAAMLKPRIKIELQTSQQPYLLDQASLRPVEAFDLKQNDKVLDLCAAPGGKALALFTKTAIELHLNEYSLDRLIRLKNVMKSHLLSEEYSRLTFTQGDGSLFYRRITKDFDAVLVDAPCSGERHQMQKPQQLKTWTLKRSKNLSHRQMALLCSAREALKSEGQLVYSTCSISPVENEQVVERFLKKGKVKLLAHQTILPDDSDNQGPIFWAKFIKD